MEIGKPLPRVKVAPKPHSEPRQEPAPTVPEPVPVKEPA